MIPTVRDELDRDQDEATIKTSTEESRVQRAWRTARTRKAEDVHARTEARPCAALRRTLGAMTIRFCDDLGNNGFSWIVAEPMTRTSHALAA